jgi:hypothetical protein
VDGADASGHLASIRVTQEGSQVSQGCWTYQELQEELREFERQLRDAGLRDSSVHTYVDRTGRFLRWLVGEYEPRGAMGS